MKSLPFFHSLIAFMMLFAASLSQAQDSQTLFGFRSEWYYLANNVDPGTEPAGVGYYQAWKTNVTNPTIAANSWQKGPGTFGYGDSGNPPEPGYYGTEIPSSNPLTSTTQNITTYFRRTFTHTINAQWKQIVLTYIRDDGMVVYLNGTEIFRDNMPTGTVAKATLAVNRIHDAFETQQQTALISYDTFKSAFKTGANAVNVLAVEIHQSNATKTTDAGDLGDMGFDLKLEVAKTDPCFGQALPGIQATFEGTAEDVSTAPFNNVYNRPPTPNPPWTQTVIDRNFDVQWRSEYYTSGSRAILASPTDINPFGESFSSNAYVSFGGRTKWHTERINVGNYRDVTVSVKVQGTTDPGGLSEAYQATEWVKLRVLTSNDGYTYTSRTWQDVIGGSGNGTKWPEATDSVANGNLVPEFAQKYAFVPTSTNPGSGVNWRLPSFTGHTSAGTAWKASSQGKGVGYDTDTTSSTSYTSSIDPNFNFGPQMQGTTGNTSVYMLVPIGPVPNKSRFTGMRLYMKFDDGFVAYLNGVKIAQSANAPATLAFNSKVDTALGEADALAWAKTFDVTGADLTAAMAALSETGNNVLAIHGLNQATTSSDMLIWPRLELALPAPTMTALDDKKPNGESDVSTWYSFTTPDGLIPADTKSIKLEFDLACSTSHAICFDDVTISGTVVGGATVGTFAYYIGSKVEDLAQRGEKDDPDGDGISNLLEYLYNTDPSISDANTSTYRKTGNTIEFEDSFSKTTLDTFTGKIAYSMLRIRKDPYTGDFDGGGRRLLDVLFRPELLVGDIAQPADWQAWEGSTSQAFEVSSEGNNSLTNDKKINFISKNRVFTVTNGRFSPQELYVRTWVALQYPSFLSAPTPGCESGF